MWLIFFPYVRFCINIDGTLNICSWQNHVRRIRWADYEQILHWTITVIYDNRSMHVKTAEPKWHDKQPTNGRNSMNERTKERWSVGMNVGINHRTKEKKNSKNCFQKEKNTLSKKMVCDKLKIKVWKYLCCIQKRQISIIICGKSDGENTVFLWLDHGLYFAKKNQIE